MRDGRNQLGESGASYHEKGASEQMQPSWEGKNVGNFEEDGREKKKRLEKNIETRESLEQEKMLLFVLKVGVSGRTTGETMVEWVLRKKVFFNR